MMRRSRVSEMPQKQSLRAPLQRRTSSSESDASRPTMTKRPSTDRNSKIGDRVSPRNPLVERTSSSESDASRPTMTKRPTATNRNSKIGDRSSLQNPLVEKKLRTRISDLESQLGHVQEELKQFKEQLASADVDRKREAQELVKQTNTQVPTEDTPDIKDENSSPRKLPEENAIATGNLETEVFEVPFLAFQSESEIDLILSPNQNDDEIKHIETCSELVDEPSKLFGGPNLREKMGLSELKVLLAEKRKEIESINSENDKLKQQASEAAAKVSVAQAKEEETVLMLSDIGVELEKTKAEAARTVEELKAAVEAKIALETEMKTLRVQTEQWKKAASAAASVIAGEVEMGGQKVAAQSSSLGKHVGFELAGYGAFDSAEDFDQVLEGGKRKGTGIRMFGDLWKKKGQK